jgi:putative oxidoreductase
VTDRISRAFDDWALLLGRLALAAIYLPSGFSKLLHLGTFAQSLTNRGVPGGTLVAVLGAGVEFFGSLCIIVGFQTRWAALLMAAFTVVAALVSHRFWDAEEAARAMQYVQFMKNVAITGGFVILFVAGAGRYSVDRRIN